MKLFVDTAALDEIRAAQDWGILDGVTTNPSLVGKEGVDFKSRVLEICDIVDGPVSAETVEPEADAMIAEGREIASWHPNVVVKIPMTPDGMKAVKVLAEEGVRTNVTLVFSANQALLAAKAGATFISVFVGRVDDIGGSGIDTVAECAAVLRPYEFTSQVLAASIRSPLHVTQAALAGADICTMPFKILGQMFQHSLTDIGIERFLSDWNKAQSMMKSLSAA
jgi:transaldolase